MKDIKPKTNRIISLDILRGFALLGILVMNMISFALPSAHYSNPMAAGPMEQLDEWAFIFSQLFANQKFMSLFSILFGASVVLFTEKIERKGQSAAKRHYIRNFWLLLFGLFHAHIIWFGDILVPYALCSIWIYLFRHKAPKTLYLWAGGCLIICLLSNLLIGLSMPYWPAAEVADICKSWQPTSEKVALEIEAYRGSWSDHFPFRQKIAIFLETFVFATGLAWHITGLMLVGMALYKTKILTGERSIDFYKRMVLFGLGIGLPLGIIDLQQNYAHNWSCEYSFFIGSQVNYLGSLPMTLGYIGLLMLLYKSKFQAILTKYLAPVGRMALTNYLMQSLLATFIFYGYGFGLFGSVGRANQWCFILGIWLFQILFSHWWMQRFRFGPVEWLWRFLTYGKLP